MGYSHAGFDVVGVDIAPQPDYPFEFIQADVLTLLKYPYHYTRGLEITAVHASPPCQHASSLRSLHKHKVYPELIAPVRELLEATGLPWVIENVPGAAMRPDAVLCGSMFGLRFRRHRWFEFSWGEPMFAPASCDHSQDIIGVYGASDGHYPDGFKHHGKKRGPRQGTTDEIRDAMGMPWAQRRRGITEAIPPAYTKHIGGVLMAQLKVAA